MQPGLEKYFGIGTIGIGIEKGEREQGSAARTFGRRSLRHSAQAVRRVFRGRHHFLGGRFADPTLAGFLPRIGRYFPPTLWATLGWSGLAAAAFSLLFLIRPELRESERR